MRDLRADFPLLCARQLVYLDSAATAQKPRSVLEAMQRYYERSNANVHRSVYRLAEEASEALEGARNAVARFIRASDAAEVVFTRGTTESINLVAQGWAARRLRQGDEILVTEVEHHSNLLPWQRVATATGAGLRMVAPEVAAEAIGPQTRVVALSLVSNVLGTALPAERIVGRARHAGAAVVIDAAQAAPHRRLDVVALGGDFLAFSAHKMLGPTGIGVLWAKGERLNETEPLLLGGGIVREVFADRATYLDALGMDVVEGHARELATYAAGRLRDLPGVTVYGPGTERVSLVSFNLEGVHPHDMAAFLDQRGICVRAGHHCAQPLMRKLGVSGTVRASVQVYSTRAEIDALATAVGAARDELR